MVLTCSRRLTRLTCLLYVCISISIYASSFVPLYQYCLNSLRLPVRGINLNALFLCSLIRILDLLVLALVANVNVHYGGWILGNSS